MSNNFTYLGKGNKAEVEEIDHSSKDRYPNLGSLAVWIEGDCFRSGAIQMFALAGCVGAPSVEAADLICFLGGEDVDPDLYGEKAHASTYFNRRRDDREMQVIDRAKELEIPMVGLCRGMQLLHVAAGGKLYQDVRGHSHGSIHLIRDVGSGSIIKSSSLHHQMCIENDNTFALAYAFHPHDTVRKYQEYGKIMETDTHNDLEAAVWMNINAIGFQGHPELGNLPLYTSWCLQQIKDFLYELDRMNGEANGNFESEIDGETLIANFIKE